jgi:hypothetical protein
MRTCDALLLSGACLILVSWLHVLLGVEPTPPGLAGTGAAGLAVGLAGPAAGTWHGAILVLLRRMPLIVATSYAAQAPRRPSAA